MRARRGGWRSIRPASRSPEREEVLRRLAEFLGARLVDGEADELVAGIHRRGEFLARLAGFGQPARDLARLVAQHRLGERDEGGAERPAAIGGGGNGVAHRRDEPARDQVAQRRGEVRDHRAALLELRDRRAAVDEDQRVPQRPGQVVFVLLQRRRALRGAREDDVGIHGLSPPALR
ncbi:MAG: hypothetical protein KJ007_14260 [Burkholderiales bacterium]|nr:hypothetical protein [Burkholderiales bacterium]